MRMNWQERGWRLALAARVAKERRRLLAALLAWPFALTSAKAQPATKPATQTILVVGDSLSAEYGLRRGSGWVELLNQRLASQSTGYQMHNVSISGDTTSGGLTRLPAALAEHRPAVVILELGANDALRGLSLDMTRSNLARMIALSQESGARVLLVGMQIPPNYGPRYTEQFSALFQDLAKEYGISLVPFLLDGIALDRSHFQADGIHPNEGAQAQLAGTVWQELEPMLKP